MIRFLGELRYAHRVSFEQHHRPLAVGEFVCHKCDNQPCVNPDHLFAGTAADNTRDKVKKGRQAKGAMLPRTRLTEEQLMQIRALVASGAPQGKVAEMFGVGQSHVSRITNMKARA